MSLVIRIPYPENAAPPPPLMTNAEKLLLPTDTPIGTRVRVSDGFYYDGTFYAKSVQVNEKDSYFAANGESFRWVTEESFAEWVIYDQDNAATSINSVGATGDRPPWEEPAWSEAVAFTYPAVQELHAPDDTIVAVAVLNANREQANGVYLQNGTLDGKPTYSYRNTPVGQAVHTIKWNGPEHEHDGWQINHEGEVVEGDFYYISGEEQDVAFPWLVEEWTDTLGEGGGTLILVPITLGELVAGATISGAGSAAVNCTLRSPSLIEWRVTLSSFQSSSFNFYLGIDKGASLDPMYGWELYDLPDSLAYYDTGSVDDGKVLQAFPWAATLVPDGGDPPGPTITRNDVAAEGNWNQV